MTRGRQHGRAIALAGGGPLGAIYEVGALMALSEALDGFDFNDLDAYVGVSAGGFIAAGLAAGLSPAYLYRMFIDSEEAEVPFEPELLLRPALREYARAPGACRVCSPRRCANCCAIPCGLTRWHPLHALRGRFQPACSTARASTNSSPDCLRGSASSNDFRRLPRRLYLVATELDSGARWPSARPASTCAVSRAVQASAALPGLFPPVLIGGRWYVDGALKKTLHASVALKEGARLVFCINPLVPFDAQLAVREHHLPHRQLVDGGLPAVLAQTFRAIIHSRMKTGLAKYEIEYRDADVILFEPRPDDADMFFSNMFSYADRKRLARWPIAARARSCCAAMTSWRPSSPATG
jgi:NTE family protein